LVSGIGRGEQEARVLQAVAPAGEPDTYLVTPGPYVGRLGLPSGAWIDFRSRFDFESVISLILSSGRLPARLDHFRVPTGSEPFLVDLLATAYTRELRILLSGGLAKGYRSQRLLRPPYGGRIDVGNHLSRLAARPDRLATTARRITTDIVLNQILARAFDVLMRAPLRPDLAVGLAALGPALRRISRAPLRIEDVRRPVLTTLTSRYSAALALASIILQARTIAPVNGDASGASILFYMPKIWESYVQLWLQVEWPGYRIEAPYQFVLTRDGQLAEADATVWDGPRLIALYDAKYKWPEAAPDRSDLYQLVTYCERLGLTDATLVYPAEAARRTVTVGDRSVHVLGLVPRLLTENATEPT
jgi:5-methylcytosine-specific restriction endonuclease McrBC regulatory subunit McrC